MMRIGLLGKFLAGSSCAQAAEATSETSAMPASVAAKIPPIGPKSTARVVLRFGSGRFTRSTRLQRRHAHREHGGLTRIDRGQTASDGAGHVRGFAHRLAVGAERAGDLLEV